MTIKITGLDDVFQEIEDAKRGISRGKKKILKKITRDLKEATPIDTGQARDGWYYTSNSIENDVEYIDELNSGSSRQAPPHFIERTVLRKGIRPNGIIVTKK